MAQSGPILLAVGGVFLVAWYGLGRLGSSRQDRRFPKVFPGSEEFQNISRAALAAEFQPGPQVSDEMESEFPGGTVFCPCGLEKYPSGTLYCSCGLETLEDPPPPETATGERSEEGGLGSENLVCIYIAESSWKAGLIRRLLKEKRIACTCTLSNPSETGFDYTPEGEVPLYVVAGQASRAQHLLKKALWKA